MLKTLLSTLEGDTHLKVHSPLDTKTPIYLIELPSKSDFMTILTSRIKKTRLRYRSFNQTEHVRLPARDAIEYVSKACGVVIPIASREMPDSNLHNIRAAFVAGLSYGLAKPTLIMQNVDGPMPLDVRDMVKSVRHPDEIKEHFSEFALEAIETMQANEPDPINGQNNLASLSLGDAMAENEFTTLGQYYLETDEFSRTLRGEVNLVVGRKGTGKTALFSQLRNRKRNNKNNIVCDLKPEGYQLVRLKEGILSLLSDGSRDYLITAFWEYILYLEIVYKILEKDKEKQLRDHRISEKYRVLEELYHQDKELIDGDFSERLLFLSSRVVDNFKIEQSDVAEGKLSNKQLTSILYKHDLATLRDTLVDYIAGRGEIWVLFDNLDKGWPPEGLEKIDTLILRCLIDAGKKIQRELQRRDIEMHCIVFVRNDVYELLMENSADFGKEIRVSLDWSDPFQLAELLRRRIIANGSTYDVPFASAWKSLAVPIYSGEDSFHYLVDRSLMRPRNIIKEVMHCKASAVNFGHEQIENDDFDKGMMAYSHDVLIEADLELSDIDQHLTGFLYHLIGETPNMTIDRLYSFFEEHKVPEEKWEKARDHLLYFGFFGILIGDREPKYIFDFNYNSKLMQAQMKKNAEILKLCINPAFWPALEIQ